MSERLPNGRFDKGNSASKGHGRSRRPVEEQYLKVVSERVPPERFAKIVDKAAEQAEQGDAKAREFIAFYLIGKPAEYVNADLTSAGNAVTFRVVWESDGVSGTPEDAT